MSATQSSSNITEEKKMCINVVSYNVLTDALSDPSDYPDYPPRHMDADGRLELILDKLRTTIDNAGDSPPICCLQEVPLKWCVAFHTLFASMNYNMTSEMTHFKEPDHRWGIAIAHPTSIFRKDATYITRLGSLIPDRRDDEPPLECEDYSKTDLCEARKPDHSVIILKLCSKEFGCPIYAATTHLLCRFWRPNVMLMHVAALFDEVANIAKDAPSVIAGDFNINKYVTPTPGVVSFELSDLYQSIANPPPLATPSEHTTKMDTNDDLYTSRTRIKPMYKGAYAHPIHGQQSSITTFASTKFNKHTFKDGFYGHIDHIFHTPSLTLIDTMTLPSSPSKARLLPNDTEGSDHLMIGARFLFTP